MQILPYLLLFALLAANVIFHFIKAPVILLAAVIFANFPLQCWLSNYSLWLNSICTTIAKRYFQEFSNANITSLLKPGNTTYNTVLLDAKMLQLTASNKPQDIATLAFILGYPLVPVAGDYAYYTTRACYCSVTS